MLRKIYTCLLCLLILLTLCLSSCGIITVNTKNPQSTESDTVITDAPDTETDPPQNVESAAPPVKIPEPSEWEIRSDKA